MNRIIASIVWALALAGVLWGCATTAPRIPVLDMPAVRIEVSGDGWEGYDARAAFESGNGYFDRGLWREAYGAFQKVLEFEANPYSDAAMYNAGLSLTRLKMYPEAVSFFEHAVYIKEETLRQKSKWNLLDLLLRLERWEEAEVRAKSLLSEINQPEDVLEVDALLRLLRSYNAQENDQQIASLVDEYRMKLRKDQAVSRTPEAYGSYLAGLRTAYTMSPESFAELKFATAETEQILGELGQVLEGEAELLLRAQGYFLRGIRASDAEQATAGVFRIGELYDRFYRGLISIALPEGLSDEEKRMYVEELGKAIDPVKGKAELAYGRLLKFAKQNIEESPWVERANQQLDRIRTVDAMTLWFPEAVSSSVNNATTATTSSTDLATAATDNAVRVQNIE